jgi:hypothetical protein
MSNRRNSHRTDDNINTHAADTSWRTHAQLVRRLAAGALVTGATALFAMGAAAASHADTGTTLAGSDSAATSAQHPTFPGNYPGETGRWKQSSAEHRHHHHQDG